MECGGLLWPHLHDHHACHDPFNVSFVCVLSNTETKADSPCHSEAFFLFPREWKANFNKNIFFLLLILEDIQKQTEEYNESLYIYHIALTIIHGWANLL